MTQPYDIQYAETAVDDLRGLQRFDSQHILDEIGRQLAHQPTSVSRSRIKLMRQPFWSHYRIRVGDFRVYYDVDETARQVSVLRVLAKANEPTPEDPP